MPNCAIIWRRVVKWRYSSTRSRTRGWWRRVVIFTFRALDLRYPLQRRPVWAPEPFWTLGSGVYKFSKNLAATAKLQAAQRWHAENPVQTTPGTGVSDLWTSLLFIWRIFSVHAKSYTSFCAGGGVKIVEQSHDRPWGLQVEAPRFPDKWRC